jgi:hypothetical protein
MIDDQKLALGLDALKRIARAAEAIARKVDPDFRTEAELAREGQRPRAPKESAEG